MTAPTTAAAVANAFLNIQDADASSFPRIDQMKLQKLVYYAQAWWLAYNNDELYLEDIEAWPWGPIVRDLYGEFKQFGRSPIVGKRATELVKTGAGVLDFEFREPLPPSPAIQEFLQGVWETHKHLSGVQLSNATHAVGEPWTIVRDKYGSLDGKPRIPTSVIRDVFKSKLEQ